MLKCSWVALPTMMVGFSNLKYITLSFHLPKQRQCYSVSSRVFSGNVKSPAAEEVYTRGIYHRGSYTASPHSYVRPTTWQRQFERKNPGGFVMTAARRYRLLTVFIVVKLLIFDSSVAADSCVREKPAVVLYPPSPPSSPCHRHHQSLQRPS